MCDTWDLACWFCWWCCCWKWWRWDNFYCSFESAQLSEFTLPSHRMGKFLFLPQAWPISNHGHACFVSKYRWVDWCRFCCEGVKHAGSRNCCEAWTGRGQDLDDKILSRHALLRCSRKKMRSELQRWRALMINEVTPLADRGMWHMWHVCRHMWHVCSLEWQGSPAMTCGFQHLLRIAITITGQACYFAYWTTEWPLYCHLSQVFLTW